MGDTELRVVYDESGANALRRANTQVASSFGSVEKGLGGLVGKGGMLAIAGNQFLELAGKATQAGEAIFDFAKAGAQFADLEASFERMGGSAKELDDIRNALNKTVDKGTILQLRNLANTMGVAGEAFVNYARIAKLASTATGQDIDFLFNSLIVGGVRESAKILDNAGIQIKNFEQQVSAALEKMGTSVDEATQQQRSLAVSTVVSQNASALATIESLDSQADGYAQLEAAIQDTKLELGKALSEFLRSTGILDGVKGALADAQEWWEHNRDEIETLTGAAMKLIEVGLEPTIELLGLAAEALVALADVIDIAATGVKELADFMRADLGETVDKLFITDMPFATEQVRNLTVALREQIAVIQQLAKQSRDKTETEAEATTELERQNKIIGEANASYVGLNNLLRQTEGDLSAVGRAITQNAGGTEQALDQLETQMLNVEDANALLRDALDEEQGKYLKNTAKIDEYRAAILRNEKQLDVMHELYSTVVDDQLALTETTDASTSATKRQTQAYAEQWEILKALRGGGAQGTAGGEQGLAFAGRVDALDFGTGLEIKGGQAFSAGSAPQAALRQGSLQDTQNLALQEQIDLQKEFAAALQQVRGEFSSMPPAVQAFGAALSELGDQSEKIAKATESESGAFLTLASVGLAAGRQAAAAAIKNDRARSAVKGGFYSAESLAAFAAQNYPQGIAYGAAAAAHFAVAAGAGSSGGGKSSRTQAAPTRTQPTPLSRPIGRDRGQPVGGGVTNILNITFPNEAAIREVMRSMNRTAARNMGVGLDSRLTDQARQRGYW